MKGTQSACHMRIRYHFLAQFAYHTSSQVSVLRTSCISKFMRITVIRFIFFHTKKMYFIFCMAAWIEMASDVLNVNPVLLTGGVYMWKLAPVRVWYGMTLWFHTVFTWMDNSCRSEWLWRHIRLEVEDCACATRSRLPGEWFHAGANGHTAFTWHQNEFSYRNENLAPVQLRGWTCTGMTRSGMRFCAGKRIQSHKRETEWTRTGMKVAPVSCKHPPSSLSGTGTGGGGGYSHKFGIGVCLPGS